MVPDHLWRLMAERHDDTDAAPAPRDRRAQLERKRVGIQFDIDQGVLASQPENPWSHRIGLLTEALAQVEADMRTNAEVVPGPFAPVPPTPLSDMAVTQDAGITIRFAIGGELFHFEEALDWAERGSQIASPELRAVSGDPARLVPPTTPDDLRQRLAEHLRDSIFAFAVDLRDRVLDGAALPAGVTLDALARACPVCGGWTDWLGVCVTCANRKGRELQLFNERKYLLHERGHEQEERHRMMERLPLARKQLADVEAELAALGPA